ncbi:MAG: protein TolR [Rickettsiales bacterium]|nr:protein TolR [Rickettsiales bacterium]
MNEINVTPFVDVMLVLLIIFMVTAPLLTTGIKVNLPQSNANSISEKKEPVTISINSKGEIFLQKKKMNKETLIKKLSLLKKQDESLKIYIRGDKTLDYGKVMALMGDINKAGFKKIALVTELN